MSSTVIIGSKRYAKKTCPDSFLWAKENLETAPDGAIFEVEKLLHARGRHKRIWSIRQGQITLTILLKPEIITHIQKILLPIRLNQLNMALSLGILEELKSYGVRLKWPNDFVIHDETSSKKLGGMLIEVIWQNNQPAGIILGFALNVNNTFEPNDELYPIATSLITHIKETIDITKLQEKIVQKLDHWYKQWLSKDFERIFHAWKLEQACLGEKISVHDTTGNIITGIAKDILENGDLVLETENKETKTISFYQVEEIKPDRPE